MPNIPVIDDNNWQSFVDPTGLKTGYWGMFELGTQKSEALSFDDLGLVIIPESEWDDRIRQRQLDHATTRQMMDDAGLGPLNQKSIPYCWVFAPTQCCQIIRLQETGTIHKLSPASAGAPIKGFKSRGGWGSQALDYFKVNGLNYSVDWPDTAISQQYYTAENKAKAKQNITLEWYSIETWEQYGTCILNGLPIASGLPYWSHEVCDTDLTLNDHNVEFINSWDMWGDKGWGRRAGGKRMPSNGDYVVIRAMLAI